MLHLAATVLKLVGTKLGATAAAATLAVGSVAVAQTSDLDPVQPTEPTELVAEDGAEGEGDAEAPAGDDTTPGEEGTIEDGAPIEDVAGDLVDDLAPLVVEEPPVVCEGEETGASTGEDARDLGIEGDLTSPDGAPVCEDATAEDGERGSATSERVHAALTRDGDLRPGDELWGAAVSDSARAGGHGKRVSDAARGIPHVPDGVTAPPAPSAEEEPADVPAEAQTSEARGNSGKGEGKGG